MSSDADRDARRDGSSARSAPASAPAEVAALRARLHARLAGAEAAQREQALAELGELAASAAATLAGLIDPVLTAALIEPLGSDRRSEQRRAAEAIAPLVAHAPELAAELDRALDAPAPRLRWGAAFTLGRAHAVPPERAWPAVRIALSLDDGDQRWAASELACRMARHHPLVLDELRRGVGDPSPVMRKMALYCLREVRPPDLATIGRAALADPDPRVRLAALAALVEAPRDAVASAASARGVAALVGGDPDPGVRRAAAATLGKLGTVSEAALTALEEAARSSDSSLARAARDARARLAAAQR